MARTSRAICRPRSPSCSRVTFSMDWAASWRRRWRHPYRKGVTAGRDLGLLPARRLAHGDGERLPIVHVLGRLRLARPRVSRHLDLAVAEHVERRHPGIEVHRHPAVAVLAWLGLRGSTAFTASEAVSPALRAEATRVALAPIPF